MDIGHDSQIPRIRARSTLPHSAQWEVLSFFLSQKAYFNRKNFVEHNGEITNRKPYQKSPMSKQSEKKEKIDKKKICYDRRRRHAKCGEILSQ